MKRVNKSQLVAMMKLHLITFVSLDKTEVVQAVVSQDVT